MCIRDSDTTIPCPPFAVNIPLHFSPGKKIPSRVYAHGWGFPKGDACPFGYSGGQRDLQSQSVGKKAGRCEEGRLLFSRL